jgi:hypothetical protein
MRFGSMRVKHSIVFMNLHHLTSIIGWPQGIMSVEYQSCLREQGFSFAVFECYKEYTGFWKNCTTNVANGEWNFFLTPFY